MTRTPHRGSFLAALLCAAAWSCSSSRGGAGPYRPGEPLTVDVSGVFPAGATLRDAYAGRTATVSATGMVTVTPDPSGVVLLERDGSAPTPFTWANATVYFAMTDRFQNGDPANDGSYGRVPDAAGVGTWHGGDLQGLTAKLDYIAGLGATALWISPVVEQVHGWVSGGSGGDFKHHGYHGYWALDFTRLDQNLGAPADLQALVDGAHQRGMRVLLDVVMNHPGYATGDDLVACLPQVFFDGTGDAFQAQYGGSSPPAGKTWNNWNDLVSYGSSAWTGWWGVSWIRAGLGGGYLPGGTDDLTRSLAFLPDFRTESTGPAGVPPTFTNPCRSGTGVVDLGAAATVRDYLVKWHSDWVRQYGFDGFRCDTAKNVELSSWRALKDAATLALADWKAANPGKKIDDAPFWMTGEVFGHGPTKDAYFTDGGFDSLLNFTFQPALASLLQTRPSLAEAGASDLEPLYAAIAALTSTDPTFDILSYLSSHDTALFYAGVNYEASKQRQAATALLLAPGGAQIFYGDESGRRLGPSASDAAQGTRSDMNWSTTETSILQHFQTLGAFRKRHVAVGAGSHQRLASPDGTYAFARKLDGGGVQDAVAIVLTAPF